MSVFITGATGFIGGALAKRLAESGEEVTALIRNKIKARKLPKRVKRVKVPLSDFNALHKLLKPTGVVYHCAAATPHYKLSKEGYWKTNVVGTQNLLEAAVNAGVKKFIHLSSVGVYGPTTKQGYSEKTKPSPIDVYSATKLAAEELVSQISGETKTIIIQPTIAYGPGDTRPVFLSLMKAISKGLFLPIGKGNNFLHTIYIDNLVDALILASKKRIASGEKFIIGDARAYRIGEIYDTVYNLQGRKPPSFHLPNNVSLVFGHGFDLLGKFGLPTPFTSQTIKFLTQDRKYSINKAKKILSYSPKVDIKHGLHTTLSWYRKEGLL